MERRSLLKMIAATPVTLALSPAWAQQKEFNPRPGAWRTFELTTRAEVLNPSGVTRVWLPIPSVDSDYQKSVSNQWTRIARVMQAVTDGKYGAGMLYAEFADGEKAPVVELTSRFRTQDRALDWAKKGAAAEDPAKLKAWTAATDLMPTDGIVKETAEEITRGKRTDLEKVQAIYD